MTIQDFSLTEMETKVLTTLIDSLYAEKGFTDVGAEDLSQDTGIPTAQIRGVISSLVKKKLVTIDEGYGSCPLINLHYDRHDLHPTWGEE